MLEKIFKAYDVRATYPDMLNEDAAWRVGFGAAQVIAQKVRDSDVAIERADTIVVSRDMRPHSPQLAGALIDGLTAGGMNVIDLGMADTSMIYFAVNHLECAGGIQTTASHNPINYNGFKISGPQAKPIGAETGLKDICSIADKAAPRGNEQSKGKVEQMDVWDAYRKHILSFLRIPDHPIKVFVDGSNGMAGVMVPKVFKDVANLEIIDVNFEIGQGFAHEPNPLVAENMIPTQEGVCEHSAHFGACFDGDADRCMITDEKGNIIGCDHLTALLTDHFVAQNPGTTIVYDLRSSKVVEEKVKAEGATPMRSRVGHVFMKQALRETGGAFGGELSGHFYFKDNFFADSGAIAFACIVSVLGQTDKTLSDMIAPLKKYPQSGEMNFRAEDKQGVMDALKAKYADAEIDNLDGVTIDAFAGKGWWFNVRASNTEPLLRLNAEAKDQPALDGLLAEITPMLGERDAGH